MPHTKDSTMLIGRRAVVPVLNENGRIGEESFDMFDALANYGRCTARKTSLPDPQPAPRTLAHADKILKETFRPVILNGLQESTYQLLGDLWEARGAWDDAIRWLEQRQAARQEWPFPW